MCLRVQEILNQPQRATADLFPQCLPEDVLSDDNQNPHVTSSAWQHLQALVAISTFAVLASTRQHSSRGVPGRCDLVAYHIQHMSYS